MNVRHLPLVSALAVVTTGCDGGTPAEPAACTLEAAPSAAVVGGDANGDGHVDVSDGAALARSIFAGGPQPCAAALDLVPDGTINPGDVLGVWYSVGSKSAPYRPEVGAEDCPEVARTVEPPCGDGLAVGVTAPAEVEGPADASTTFTADITLTSPTLPAEAWSFTLTASGCTLVSGTTAGTDAAERGEDPPGLRDEGVAWQAVTEAEAHVLTVLDWRRQGALPVGAARTIHRFTVSGTPVSGCATCTLSLVAGDPVAGVESVVSAEGWRYVPALGTATVSMCPG